MIERSQAVARGEHSPPYGYRKRTVIERLDSSGLVTGSEEKFYQVSLIAGLPFNRLLRIQGRELTPQELQEQQRREERFQEKISSIDPKQMAARKEGLVNAALLDHYQFAVMDRIVVSNRPVLVVNFKPKEAGLVENTLRDKILNRIEGTFWIDEQDADTVKVTARLTETVSMGWFGLLGSLSRCEFALERQRMADGAWVNVEQAWAIQARRLTTPVRYRITETSSDFEPLAAN